MKIVEILDGAGIDSSSVDTWIEESKKFRLWYCKLGTHYIDEVAIEKACLKVYPKEKPIKSIAEYLEKYK